MAERDAKGRFTKGKSGNPGGRGKKDKTIEEYGKRAPEKLIAIAQDVKTPVKIRAEIWRWFAEMTFGKPKPLSESGQNAEGLTDIKFEGELDKWSK